MNNLFISAAAILAIEKIKPSLKIKNQTNLKLETPLLHERREIVYIFIIKPPSTYASHTI
jgi:hypothetical protein